MRKSGWILKAYHQDIRFIPLKRTRHTHLRSCSRIRFRTSYVSLASPRPHWTVDSRVQASCSAGSKPPSFSSPVSCSRQRRSFTLTMSKSELHIRHSLRIPSHYLLLVLPLLGLLPARWLSSKRLLFSSERRQNTTKSSRPMSRVSLTGTSSLENW